MNINDFKSVLLWCLLAFSAPSCTSLQIADLFKGTANPSRVEKAPVAKKTTTKTAPVTPKVEEKIDLPSRTTAASEDEMVLRQTIVAYSDDFLGTSYKYAGKVPETGFDCSGFTSYVMKNFDINISSSSSAQAKEGKKIKPKEALPGDIIVFGKGGKINHVGMVYSNENGNLKVIHSTSRGVVIDNIYKSTYWKPRIMYAVDVVGK